MVGEPITVDVGDPLYYELANFSMPNNRAAINVDCFSELQWIAMQQGKYLCQKDMLHFDMHRDRRKPLTLSEIYTLSGEEKRVKRDPDTMELMPDNEYIDEYVPFTLPRMVIREGREQKVYSNWFLPNARPFRNELENRFKMALSRFIAIDRSSVNALEEQRSKMEAIDRFLLKYDIRTSDRVREQMKKLMQRSVVAAQYSYDSDEDHANWSASNPDTPRRKRGVPPKPVICLETGERYVSIGAAARAVNASQVLMSKCIRDNHRCHGLHFAFIEGDTPQSTTY